MSPAVFLGQTLNVRRVTPSPGSYVVQHFGLYCATRVLPKRVEHRCQAFVCHLLRITIIVPACHDGVDNVTIDDDGYIPSDFVQDQIEVILSKLGMGRV
jgi:hypothetical protein